MHFDFSWKGIWLEHLVLVVCSAILCIVTLIGCTTNDQRVAEGPIEPSSTPAVAESKDSWMKPTVPTEPLPTPTVTESELQDSKEFLVSTYGFSDKDLEGLNTDAFVDDYGLRMRDYSSSINWAKDSPPTFRWGRNWPLVPYIVVDRTVV